MKFNKSTAIRLSVLLLCAIPFSALSASADDDMKKEVSAQLRPDMTIRIDGSERSFYNVSGKEVHPILYNGTTYLPVRSIGELMGRKVEWNEETRTVTLSGYQKDSVLSGTPDDSAVRQEITAQLREDFTIIIDGKARDFYDANGKIVYPMLYNGSTYLPVRAIGTLMGKEVGWNGETETVTLTGEMSLTDYGPDHDGITDYGFTDYGKSDYNTTDYGTTDYGKTDYGTTDYGKTDYGTTDYGKTAYGTTDYGNSDYNSSDYGNSDYDSSDYGNSDYDSSDYGNSDYDSSDYGNSDYDSSDYGD